MKLLGVDVWVQRAAAGSSADTRVAAGSPDPGGAGEPRTADAAAVAVNAAGSTQQLRAELTAAESGRAAAVQATTVDDTSGGSASTVPEVADLEAVQVLSLRCPGRLLLAEIRGVKGARRLLMDLLLAGSGNWDARVANTAFVWPPERKTVPGLSGRRALLAFVEKQLDDSNEAGVLIACERLLELLPEIAESMSDRGVRLLPVPQIRVLMQDGEAKRDLWRKMQLLNRR